MSRATRLIRTLDKELARHTSFGDTPKDFVDELVTLLKDDLNSLKAKNKPHNWAEIYVERDRALIKQEVLNRVMALGSE